EALFACGSASATVQFKYACTLKQECRVAVFTLATQHFPFAWLDFPLSHRAFIPLEVRVRDGTERKHNTWSASWAFVGEPDATHFIGGEETRRCRERRVGVHRNLLWRIVPRTRLHSSSQ